ncbi:MAG: ImmA/IrrE family metallo-endopeptidase [Candidatus Methylomirabilales bacterium]
MNKGRIRELAIELLAECSISEPPTRKEPLLEHLSVRADTLPLAIEDLMRLGFRYDLTPNIRAVSDVKEKEIYIHPILHYHQETWAVLHEIGHFRIDWHRELLYLCSEYDLSAQVRKIMEKEANDFAAECLFQGERFWREAYDYPFGMASVKLLADRYASFEATCRRYVENCPEPCALIVLAPRTRKKDLEVVDGLPLLHIQYFVRSPTFGTIFPPHQTLQPENPLSQLFHGERVEEILDAEFPVRNQDSQKLTLYRSQSFTNRYKVFTLLWPK